MKRIFLIVSSLVVFFSLSTNAQIINKSNVEQAMKKVNNYWIQQNPDYGDNKWYRGVYYTGNMAMYKTFPEAKYLTYATEWAKKNSWTLNGRVTTTFADNHVAGQTYIDLYNIRNEAIRIRDIQISISGMLNSTTNDNWHWVDALYMAMPVFSKLGKLNNDNRYFTKMFTLYSDTKVRRKLYNQTAGLWYRDEKFVPPFKTKAGKDSFWSRGNGWVFGALVKVLEDLPTNHANRAEYIKVYKEMASALIKLQRNDGFWNTSLLDPTEFGGPETSGTALFLYGIAWGINNNILPETQYRPVVEKGWKGILNLAIHQNGKLGYVQPRADRPGPSSYNSTEDYGVGAFLLAGSEIYKMASGTIIENYALNNLLSFSAQQTGNEARNCVDGDLSTRWSANGYPQSIEIDMKELKTINRTEVATFGNRQYRYIIQSKKTLSSAYTTIVNRSSNTFNGENIVDTFSPLQSRYLKVTFIGANNYSGTWVSINEFGVYGPNTTAKSMLATEEDKVGLFPNPSANGIFQLTETANWYVYSSDGTLVKEGKGSTIDLAAQPKGIYHLKLDNGVSKSMLIK